MAEFEWGMIIWFCTLLPLLRPPQLPSDADEDSSLLSHRSPTAARGLITRTDLERRERRTWVATHVVLFTFEVMWLISAIYFSTTDPYRSAFPPDDQHRHDELLGWQRSLGNGSTVSSFSFALTCVSLA